MKNQSAAPILSDSDKAETRIVVSAKEYEWLCQIMDEAPALAPRLRAALAQKPVWDDLNTK